MTAQQPSNAHAPPSEPLLTVKAVAEATGLPAWYWYERIAKEDVPVYRLGRAVRFAMSDVREWLAKQQQPAKTQAQGRQ